MNHNAIHIIEKNLDKVHWYWLYYICTYNKNKKQKRDDLVSYIIHNNSTLQYTTFIISTQGRYTYRSQWYLHIQSTSS